MFHLNSSLPGGSDKWDTNFARLNLQVSEDQLEKINKIPGWSKTEIEKTATDLIEKTLENIEKQLTQRPSTENILTSANITAKDNDNLKNYNSNINSKQNPVASLNEKELFLKNFSLSPLRKKHTTAYSLQRSRSLSDLCEKSLCAEKLSYSDLEEIYRKQLQYREKDLSSSKHAPLLTKNILDKTYVVPEFSDDCVNHNKLLEISHKTFSCTLENPNRLIKQNFKTLDDSVLNHKYLKATGTPVTMSDISKETVITAMKQEMSLIERRLFLLQRRISPSKETSQPPLNSKLINLENSNCEKYLKSSQNPAPAVKVVTAVVSSDSTEDLSNEKENSSISQSNESFESQANSQSINEKSDALKNTIKSANNRTGDVSKTAVCNFDSFVSPPLPCGQPIPTEVLSDSGLIPSRKLIELNSPTKSQNASLPVPCGHPPTEVPSLSQPILSQKSAKLNTPSKLQSAELVGKPTAQEKPSDTFSVFSANLNEKVSDLASDKEMGTKRKRRNRSEKSSKKSDAKKIKRSDIQFSSAQIRSMIEIMKIFHTGF